MIFSSYFNEKNFNLDMVKSSHINTKTSISSLFDCDYTEPANGDEEQLGNGGIGEDVDQMFEQLDDVEEESMDDNNNSYDESLSQSDDESNADSSQVKYSPFCGKVTRKKELPTPLFAGKKFVFLFSNENKFEVLFF